MELLGDEVALVGGPVVAEEVVVGVVAELVGDVSPDDVAVALGEAVPLTVSPTAADDRAVCPPRTTPSAIRPANARRGPDVVAQPRRCRLAVGSRMRSVLEPPPEELENDRNLPRHACLPDDAGPQGTPRFRP